MLKKLCLRGIFKNEGGTVTSVISKNGYYSAQSRKIVDEAFSGSLPAFLAAFASGSRLTEAEIDEIQQMIDSYKTEDRI